MLYCRSPWCPQDCMTLDARDLEPVMLSPSKFLQFVSNSRSPVCLSVSPVVLSRRCFSILLVLTSHCLCPSLWCLDFLTEIRAKVWERERERELEKERWCEKIVNEECTEAGRVKKKKKAICEKKKGALEIEEWVAKKQKKKGRMCWVWVKRMWQRKRKTKKLRKSRVRGENVTIWQEKKEKKDGRSERDRWKERVWGRYLCACACACVCVCASVDL